VKVTMTSALEPKDKLDAAAMVAVNEPEDGLRLDTRIGDGGIAILAWDLRGADRAVRKRLRIMAPGGGRGVAGHAGARLLADLTDVTGLMPISAEHISN
jgi:hypothetical protein